MSAFGSAGFGLGSGFVSARFVGSGISSSSTFSTFASAVGNGSASRLGAAS